MFSRIQYNQLINKCEKDHIIYSGFEFKKSIEYKLLLEQGTNIVPYLIKDLFRNPTWISNCLMGDIFPGIAKEIMSKNMAGKLGKQAEKWVDWYYGSEMDKLLEKDITN